MYILSAAMINILCIFVYNFNHLFAILKGPAMWQIHFTKNKNVK